MSAPSARERRPGEPLAWGSRTDVRPTRTAERPCMRLLAFREIRKGTLIGYARIRLPIGLTIVDVAIIAGKNGIFAALPTKAQFDRDGRQHRDANGKSAYAKILEWRDRVLGRRFSEVVVSPVRAVHPAALDGDAR
jgi:hypothetical protein